MSSKKDQSIDVMGNETSDKKKRPESRYNASVLREYIKEGLDAKSIMLANGADLAAVSKLMGHSTVKMTADVYYHYLEGEKEKAVGKLPSLIGV